MKDENVSWDEKFRRLNVCITEAKTYELWRKMARETLMCNLAPRIHRLGELFYRGCGFHYDLEQQVGKLIASLAIGEQPDMMNMNDYDRLDEIWAHILVRPVVFEHLCQQVIKAERSAEELRPSKS